MTGPKDSDNSARLAKRCKRFVRSHRQTVVLIGASIAFAMYVVRDEVGQNLKDLVDSINAATTISLVRSDNRDIRLEIGKIEQFLQQGKPIWLGQAGWDTHFKNLSAELDSIVWLLHSVPHDEKVDKEVYDLIAKERKLASDSLFPIAPPPKGPIVRDKAAEAAEQAHQTKVSMDAMLLDSQVQDLGTSVLLRAQEALEREERRYRITVYASYILYPVGWLIGLAGTMFGVEGAGLKES